ncbi:FecR/PupR family sigma factor regulator [Isoalcanivorax pacificus]|nr:DUF4880 domain-containing protein [Isoalcanivorax pacificus]
MADRDPAWEQAMDWVMREHEQGALDASDQRTLHDWLAAAPAHQKAYQEARRVWLLTGMLPGEGEV